MLRIKAKWVAAIGLLTLCATAGADEWDDWTAYDPDEVELTQSERWLKIQREGTQATSWPQQQTPQERELVNQRWLDSLSHPIPEFFDTDAAGSFSSDD